MSKGKHTVAFGVESRMVARYSYSAHPLALQIVKAFGSQSPPPARTLIKRPYCVEDIMGFISSSAIVHHDGYRCWRVTTQRTINSHRYNVGRIKIAARKFHLLKEILSSNNEK